jgi:hypothetical protein
VLFFVGTLAERPRTLGGFDMQRNDVPAAKNHPGLPELSIASFSAEVDRALRKYTVMPALHSRDISETGRTSRRKLRTLSRRIRERRSCGFLRD